MAGYPVNKATLDARTGELTQRLRDCLAEIQTVKGVLDGITDETLEAEPWGYTEDEVATIKSAFTDLDKLARIAHGQETQPAASDFFFFAKRLTGLQ